MNKNAVNQYAVFAYNEAVALAGNSGLDTERVWAECHQNDYLRSLAGMYLVGSSDRSERNLERLRSALRQVFGLEG